MLRRAAEFRENVGRGLEFERDAAFPLHFLVVRAGGAIIGDSRSHDDDIGIARAIEHGASHLLSRAHGHPIDAIGNFQVRGAADQHDTRSAAHRSFCERVTHFA